MTAEQLLIVAAIAGLYLLFVSIERRRENLRHNLRALAFSGLVGLVVFAYFKNVGWEHTQAIVVGVLAALFADRLFPRRGRYIPKSVKKQVIARFEAETGQTFNRRIHEIDHEVPFSKGGSNTADNLRVVKKRKNRSKGAKSAWWDLLSR